MHVLRAGHVTELHHITVRTKKCGLVITGGEIIVRYQVFVYDLHGRFPSPTQTKQRIDPLW